MGLGQYLGTRTAYVYTSDNETEYVVRLDDTLATLSGTGFTDFTTASTATAKPAGLTMRYVLWQSSDGVYRKKIHCGQNDAALFANDTSTALTIDGIAGFTTGRVGEKMTYVRAKAAA